ncbi:unconventional prefoldin RPB5 interactor 1 [Trichomycterus rosablanca]|uniref:unconventional prefoldin RPB5 interactor 1 n=1 Tax=Trichomycterus rosablanca TaxID=2290929 RepID=UPI002F358850
MAGEVGTGNNLPEGIERLKEEHREVVKDCKSQIAHWKKVENDYNSLQERLTTLPDKLSYDIMVPFSSLAFMPGKLIHTNELTVLLGDNWFAKCSSKQAHKLVEHRKIYVKNKLDDLHKTMKNFQDRAGFTENLERMTGDTGDFIDIREEVGKEKVVNKGKHRMAHMPNSKPKEEYVVQLEEETRQNGESFKEKLSEEELWARLDELDRLEEEQDERDRLDSTDTNGEDTTSSSSSSSEEEKEADSAESFKVNGHEDHAPASHTDQVNGIIPHLNEDEQDEDIAEMEESNGLPTIYFNHTVEPKKVRINTGKNMTLKFSEKKEQKEQAKRKKKNGKSNGHNLHEHHKITTPSDIYRVFVDVVNGEPVPRKSILKSRSRENSVCSDTSESSTADFEERRAFVNRSLSHDDATHSDGITEEDSSANISLYPNGRFEAFSGTVIEKDPLPSVIPHLTIAAPALPTIPERKQEELGLEPTQELPKRVSKFKAARQQQK